MTSEGTSKTPGEAVNAAHIAHLDQLEAAYRGAKEAALAAARKAAEVDRLAAEGQDMGIQVNTMAARLGIAHTRVSIRASRHRERLRKALGGRE